MWKCAGVLLLAASLTAQCPKCEDAGQTPCTRCPSAEKEVRYCSQWNRCTMCRGARFVDCSKCSRPAVEKALRARRENARRWLLHQRRVLAESIGAKKGAFRSALVCETSGFDLVFAPAKIRRGPSSDPHVLMHEYVRRIDALRKDFVATLGFDGTEFPEHPWMARRPTKAVGSHPSPRMRIYVQQSAAEHRRLCRGAAGLVHQGLGVKRMGGDLVYALLHEPGEDNALHRNLAHNVTHLLLSNVKPFGWLGERGYGWLDGGLAHWFEARAGGGLCTEVCFHERAQRPLKFRAGKWLDAVRDMVRAGRLPRLANVLGRHLSDLTPEEHVVAFAFVSFLIEKRGGPKLGELVREAKRGVRAADGLKTVFGAGVATLETGLRTWLGGRGIQGETDAAPRHFALYIYPRSLVRPRHAKVVKRALQRRVEAHTSGWRIEKGKPVVELGPAAGLDVRHWRGDKAVTSTPAAWPFAAVLEFEAKPGDKAYLDWFRRKRGSRDGGAWFLDPPGTYVSHINAETVCGEDDTYHYMAVVDTPTGDAITSNEFAVRARLVDAKGRELHRGWWVRFGAKRGRQTDDWWAEMTPLVPWRIARVRKGDGAVASAPVEVPARELVVFGTNTVFRFPRIPDGVRPCTPKK